MGETGFLYAVICAVAQMTAHIATGFCQELLLTERESGQSGRKRVMIWSVIGSWIIGAKCLLPLPFAFLAAVNPIVTALFIFFFLKIFYSNKWGAKLFHAAMLSLQNILADLIAQSVLGYPQGNDPLGVAFRSRIYADTCVMVAAISLIFFSVYTVIVLRIWNRKRIKTNIEWMAGMLFFGMLFFLVFVIRDSAGEGARVYFMSCCTFMVMLFAAVMLYLSRSEKKEAQEERQRMMEEVKELQHAIELEKIHYEQIEARREEMAKLRHDYNNVITSVMYLIENGKMDEAREIMKDLSERISRTGE